MFNNIKLKQRFNEVLPWGASTCSKAPVYDPEEPSAIIRGKGCRVWDVDGREFIDFRNGLGPVTLGYCFPAVDDAIRRQLEDGILYGQPHPLECEVAELARDIIPCAERVRFLKTGGEAIAACIKLARTYTERDNIIQIGYNGWLNSLAQGTKVLPGQSSGSVPPGVPKVLSELHHTCSWNDTNALEKLFEKNKGQIAAVVVAADYAYIDEGKSFYPFLREITQKNGSLLIYDEIVTGMRVAIGGVQEYFGVLPDLAVFSKGIANGMPLSVYAGSREVMDCCDKGGKAVISSTFAGEALSLAAAKAAIQTYRDGNVINHLWKQGEKMWNGLNCIFSEKGIGMRCVGYWPCVTFTCDEPDLKDKFMRFAYKYGVSLYNVNYVNFSHGDGDIAEALERLEMACTEMK